MIPNFDDRDHFASVLHANVSPTSPIESQEHLYGREKQVRQIEQALYAPGRSIFIYGTYYRGWAVPLKQLLIGVAQEVCMEDIHKFLVTTRNSRIRKARHASFE